MRELAFESMKGPESHWSDLNRRPLLRLSKRLAAKLAPVTT